jgi:hypothetical protein
MQVLGILGNEYREGEHRPYPKNEIRIPRMDHDVGRPLEVLQAVT